MISFKIYINEWKYNSNSNIEERVVYRHHPLKREQLYPLIIHALKENPKKPYLLDIDTSEIEDLSFVFNPKTIQSYKHAGVDLTKIEYLDLHTWKTPKTTDMSNMFSGLSLLEYLDISNFDTSNVTNMSNMFFYCINLKTLKLNFDTSNLINMRRMFYSCAKLKTVDGINDWNINKVINIDDKTFEGSSVKIPDWYFAMQTM